MKKILLPLLMSFLWISSNGQTIQEHLSFESYKRYIGERLYAPDNRIYLFTEQPTTIQTQKQFTDSYHYYSKFSTITYDKVSTLMYKPVIPNVIQRTLTAKVISPTSVVYKYTYNTPVITCNVAGQYFTIVNVIPMSEFKNLTGNFFDNITTDINELYNSKIHKNGRILSPTPRTFISGWGKQLLKPDSPVFALEDADGGKLYWIPQFKDQYTDMFLASYLENMKTQYVNKTFINIGDHFHDRMPADLYKTFTVENLQYQSAESLWVPTGNSYAKRLVNIDTETLSRAEGSNKTIEIREGESFLTACSKYLPQQQFDWAFTYVVGVTLSSEAKTVTIGWQQFYSNINNERNYKEYAAYVEEQRLRAQREEQERLEREARANAPSTGMCHEYRVITNGRPKTYYHNVEITMYNNPRKVVFTNKDTREVFTVDRIEENSTRNGRMGVNQMGMGAGVEQRAKVNGVDCVFGMTMSINAGIVQAIYTIKYLNGNMRIYYITESLQ